MSPSVLEAAESQWLAQLTAMREALAELKLPPSLQDGQINGYGHDIDLDDDDDDDISGPSGSDDPWDLYSDEYDCNLSTDMADGLDIPPQQSGARGASYGPEWLQQKCFDFASKNSGMSAEDLQGQLVALLGSDSDGMVAQHHKVNKIIDHRCRR